MISHGPDLHFLPSGKAPEALQVYALLSPLPLVREGSGGLGFFQGWVVHPIRESTQGCIQDHTAVEERSKAFKGPKLGPFLRQAAHQPASRRPTPAYMLSHPALVGGRRWSMLVHSLRMRVHTDVTPTPTSTHTRTPIRVLQRVLDR